MANIQIPNSGTITITGSVNTSGTGLSVGSKTITLNTRDTYVYENIDVNVDATVDVQAGSLSNTASPNVTYSPNTDQSTVLPAQGTLYINEGWYPATSITLGHMIPDIATNDAGDNHILNGYKAYDEDGNLITGTLATVVPTFKGGAITVTPSVTNLTVPTATIASTGTFKTASTYGVTSSQPSGNDGTAYLTIDGTISKTDGSVKASADATRAAVLYDTNTTGNIAQNPNDVALTAQTTPTSATTASATTIEPTVTDNFAPLYIPIVSATFGGGDITPTAGGSVTTAPVVTYSETASGKNGSGTSVDIANYGVETTTSASTNGYITFEASGSSTTTGKVTPTANATSTAVTYTNAAGAIAAHSGATAITPTSSGQVSGSAIDVTATATAGTTTKYRIPIVSPTGEGGEVSKTSGSGSISGTAPTVTLGETGTFLPTGTGNTGANYGVTTTKPSGTDGTAYLTITPTGSTTTKGSYSGTATINYSRAAVTPDGNYQGAVNMSDSDVFLSSDTGSFTHALTSATNIDATIASNPQSYYIPVVTPKGTGGGLTVNSGSITNLSGTAPNVAVSASGSFTTSGTTYGITTTAPGSGTDGTNYLTLNYDGTPGSAQSYTADITLNYNRAAVNADNTYKGAVSMTTSTELLAAATSQSASQANVSVGNIQATKTGGGNYYVPIVTPTAAGGDLTPTSTTIGCTETNTLSVTPKVEFADRNNTTESSITTSSMNSTYGVVVSGTAPTSGHYVKLDPGATVGGSAKVDASVQVTRSAITVSSNPGLTDGTGTGISSTSKTYSGSKTIQNPTPAEGTNYYVPVVSVPANSSVTNAVTDPTVDTDSAAAYGGTGQTGTPAGFKTSNTGMTNYITITPSASATGGTVTSTVSDITINKGITAGGTITGGTDTDAIGISAGTATLHYIEVYDGTYSIA